MTNQMALCPFCGSTSDSTNQQPFPSKVYSYWIARCGNPECGAEVTGLTPEQAVERWNKRVSPEPKASRMPAAWMRGVVSPGGPWGPPEHDWECYAGDEPPEDANKDWIPLYRDPEVPASCNCESFWVIEAIEPHAPNCPMRTEK